MMKDVAPPLCATHEQLAKAVDSALFLQRDLLLLVEHNGVLGALALAELAVLAPMIRRLRHIADLADGAAEHRPLSASAGQA